MSVTLFLNPSGSSCILSLPLCPLDVSSLSTYLPPQQKKFRHIVFQISEIENFFVSHVVKSKVIVGPGLCQLYYAISICDVKSFVITCAMYLILFFCHLFFLKIFRQDESIPSVELLSKHDLENSFPKIPTNCQSPYISNFLFFRYPSPGTPPFNSILRTVKKYACYFFPIGSFFLPSIKLNRSL